eukprot:GFYU01010475.1.p1 GENE.GFYU01010475.1~~GFYU01010475.1.p1  ORF type:complete len:273 (-),score=37.25 GFYU01010475.1:538-1356(-)
MVRPTGVYNVFEYPETPVCDSERQFQQLPLDYVLDMRFSKDAYPESDPVLGDAPHQTTVQEKSAASAMATRFLFSAPCSCLYLFMILMCLIIIVGQLLGDGKRPWDIIILTLEIIVNVFLVSEVSLRLLAEGRKYWDYCGNVFDFSVMILCIAALVIDIQCVSKVGWCTTEEEKYGDLTSIVIRVFRDVIRFFRLLLLIKNQRRNQLPDDTAVDFSKIPQTQTAEGSNSYDPDTSDTDHEGSWLIRKQKAVESTMPPQREEPSDGHGHAHIV